MSRLRFVALALTLLVSGCLGAPAADGPAGGGPTAAPPSGSATTTDARSTTAATTQTATTPTVTPAVSNRSAMQRAVRAEERRVERALANVTNVSGSVGVMRHPEATVVSRSRSAVLVRVRVFYSYEYHCDGNAGAADGMAASARYRVTAGEVRLLAVTGPVRTVCDD